jgi:hypothetical protein
VLNKSKYILYLRFFKVAIFALMTALQTLGITHLENQSSVTQWKNQMIYY